jgi:hypothetical protein
LQGYDFPGAGPHGLVLDPGRGRLFCACDAAALFSIDAVSGRTLGEVGLSGEPDVIVLAPQTGRLYVAIGNRGSLMLSTRGQCADMEWWQRKQERTLWRSIACATKATPSCLSRIVLPYSRTAPAMTAPIVAQSLQTPPLLTLNCAQLRQGQVAMLSTR